MIQEKRELEQARERIGELEAEIDRLRAAMRCMWLEAKSLGGRTRWLFMRLISEGAIVRSDSGIAERGFTTEQQAVAAWKEAVRGALDRYNIDPEKL